MRATTTGRLTMKIELQMKCSTKQAAEGRADGDAEPVTAALCRWRSAAALTLRFRVRVFGGGASRAVLVTSEHSVRVRRCLGYLLGYVPVFNHFAIF
jgi:hypothetical protein